VAPTPSGTPPHRPTSRRPAAGRSIDDRTTAQQPATQQPETGDKLDPTLVEPPARKRRFGKWRKAEATAPPPLPPPAPEEPPAREPDPALAPPGYHIYRPTGTPGAGRDDQDRR
jgi:hypothetical protein